MYNGKGKTLSTGKYTKVVKKSIKTQEKIKKKGLKGKKSSPPKKAFKVADYFDKDAGPLGGFKGITKK